MITLPVIVESINPRKDKTWKLTFSTNELTPVEVGSLAESLQKFGYLAFKQENFTTNELEAVEGLETKLEGLGKSPSLRLRNVLLVLYKQNNEGFTTFNSYYESQMEKLINHFKNKIA